MAPVFDFAMIVLNQKNNKTSRFYVKGSNFTDTSKVSVNGKECDRTKCINSNVLAVALKYANWPALQPTSGYVVESAGTGEIDVTISVTDGTDTSTPTQVTVVVVNDDDLT
jgi:hypothetical protein